MILMKDLPKIKKAVTLQIDSAIIEIPQEKAIYYLTSKSFDWKEMIVLDQMSSFFLSTTDSKFYPPVRRSFENRGNKLLVCGL